MPKATKTEEDEYRLPAEVYFPAKLKAVTSKTIDFEYKAESAAVKKGRKKAGDKGSFDKWEWEFEITDGDYKGASAYGDTDARLTTRDDDVVRQWAETLMGREIEIGEEFDTDNIIGYSCLISVRHDDPRPKKDGGFFYGCPVDDVLPASGSADFVPF